jgi:hypothetical protein
MAEPSRAQPTERKGDHWGVPTASYLRIYGVFSLLLTAFIAVFNYTVDPLQIYRRASYDPIYIENQRHQNVGLARNYEYETVVIGDSHTENFSPSQIERVLGERTLKLSIEGSTSAEQLAILETAIDTGQVRRVIWGIEMVSFRRSPESALQLFYVPAHLYDDAPRSVARYVLALDTLTLSMNAMLRLGHRNLESLNRWGDEAEFGYPSVRIAWGQRMRSIRRRATPRRKRAGAARVAEKRLRQHLVAIVAAHPEIEFDVFFPPYSILAHVGDLEASQAEFDDRIAFKRSVIEQLIPYDNARIFDFQRASTLTHDFRNYKDLHHYAPEINDYMITSIARGRHEVDERSYEDSLTGLVERTRRFRLRACETDGPLAELCPDLWTGPQPRFR